ncbi:DUF3592 domain-containing protein [Actinomadura fibrosa]|uniref:DUF3592 domain-containing protein n=1 Tax=Actinomadura fibrosa TaxID=111802 RepID=A0ABW2XCX7_9ACTN|nr:DUF3592 domain-containing protein [Actinomadura fibrosa]
MWVPSLGTVVIAVLTGLVVAFAVSSTLDAVERERKSIEADGTVVKRWLERKTSYADVVFTTAAGARIQTSISQGDWASMPKVGDKVRLRYLPAKPADGVADARQNRFDRHRMPILYWAIVAAFAVATGWSHRQSMAARRGK